MVKPEQEAIDTFMSITGLSEADATRKLEEHSGNLNEAVNAHFAEGDSSINQGASVMAVPDDNMDIDDPLPINMIGPPASLLPSAGDLNPFPLLDPNFARNIFDRSPIFTSPSPFVSRTGPSAPSIVDVPDDIEEEMIRAAIEASKQDAAMANQSDNQVDLRDTAYQPTQSHVEDAEFDAEFARAVSLSLQTAQQEKASKEQTGNVEAQQPEDLKLSASEQMRASSSSNGRQSQLEAGTLSVLDEAEDVEEHGRRRVSSVPRSTIVEDTEEDEVIPPSSPQHHDNWGGISSEEHDEAVILEAAMFGGIPEETGYNFPYAPHQHMQNGSDGFPVPYTSRMPRPIREQQDDEYLAALQADREKELKAQEEAEAALAEERRKEEEVRRQLQEEQAHAVLTVLPYKYPPLVLNHTSQQKQSDRERNMTSTKKSQRNREGVSTVLECEKRLSLLNISQQEQVASPVQAPIVSSYNDRIRPLLDAIDRLRNLKVMQEGIQLPTIVVVGDQSSGKSSVLESLAGISLPRGQGICTRVPLIMRLQNHANPQAELFLEFSGKVVPTDETHIADAIVKATDEMAGKGKGISNNPLTLVVKKKGVPDLTMVDLPGITRVPVHGQPDDIYEQISNIIKEYITPEESIILNVLSASVDFTTCESIRMSQQVDKSGGRTLAVVTKVDRSPEGLLEKVTTDDVNIGLGYVCVRNRIGDESYEQAREEEARLFESHHLLAKISKSMVGIPVLAQKLVQIQATIIVKCLPDIVRKINDKLSVNMDELNKLPQNMTSIAEAMTAFMHILGSAKDSLRKILVQGEFDEYPEEMEMHCTARFVEMLNEYSNCIQLSKKDPKEKFLMDEIRVLEEKKSIGLPNFMPRAAFLTLLQKRVKTLGAEPFLFVDKTWSYIENVLISVLMRHSDNYPQLLSTTRRATQNLVIKKKQQGVDWVNVIVEMEKLTDYTCDPEYVALWNKYMAQQNQFMEVLNDHSKPPKVNLEEYGEVDVAHLRDHMDIVQEAFDMKMRMDAYWKIVLRRLVDGVALHLLYSIKNLVSMDMEKEIIGEVMGPEGNGFEKMLEESPYIAEKRKRLNNSIKLLKESRDVVAKIMDKIATDAILEI